MARKMSMVGELKLKLVTPRHRPAQLLEDHREYKVNDTVIQASKSLMLFLVPTQIMQLLGHAGLRRIFANHGAGGSGITLQLDDGNNIPEDSLGGLGIRRKRRAKGSNNRFPPVPSEAGQKLMDGGVFGSNEYYRDTTRRRSSRLAGKLMNRELGSSKAQSTRTASAISQV